MDDVAVLTPSFRGDALLFADLHASVLAYTAPSVVHHVIVPPSDVHLFRQYEGSRCRVWTHRDLLPRYCLSVPYASGLTLNMRLPWPPIRGWVTQQLMKIAGTAALDARAVLVVDSDAVLLRELTLDQFLHDGRVRHYRADRAVTAGMERHLLWHRVARRLLGVSGTVMPPAPDYISPVAVWDPAVVRSMMDQIADSTGRYWMDAVAGELHVSEFMIYGVFVDQVLGGSGRPLREPLCHNYYERTPLNGAQARAFADEMPPNVLGAMISSHSRTPPDVRLDAYDRCREIARGRPSKAAALDHEAVLERGSSAQSTPRRSSLHQRCLDVALLATQVSPFVTLV